VLIASLQLPEGPRAGATTRLRDDAMRGVTCRVDSAFGPEGARNDARGGSEPRSAAIRGDHDGRQPMGRSR